MAWALPVALAGLTGMGFAGRWSFEVLVSVGYPLIAVLAMLAVVGVVMAPASPVGWALSTRPPVYLGRISYGIYLWHMPIFLETQARHLPFGRELAIEFGLTAGAVLGSYYLIERPFLRLKARLRD
jgi:peptidoglycan/LPS O-acetylase OafA/YrhL